MNELDRVRYLYKLKNVTRSNSVGNRKETSAEHCWSALILADYFLSKIKLSLDAVKVYQMLLYHDLVEIETGDICITNDKGREGKTELERKAITSIRTLVPNAIGDNVYDLFLEFERSLTPEAKFCKAIDALDAVIHELDYKKDWKGWTERFIREKKEFLFEDFPEIKKLFEEALIFARKNDYFD